jgi:hypothetical protein
MPQFQHKAIKPIPIFNLPVSLESLAQLRGLKRSLELSRAPVSHRFVTYQDAPVKFVQEAQREFVWSKQQEVLQSVQVCRRTAVRSCHDSGKSFIAARAACWWIACHPPGEAFVVTSAPTFPQVRAILWREINRAHNRGQLPGYCNQVEWMLDNEIVAFGRKPSDEDPAAFQGIHARYVLVIFDEACGIPAPLWDAADSLIANEGGRFLAIGNPDDPNTEFARICTPGSGWNVIGISAFDTPNFTEEDVPDLLRPMLISRTWVEEKQRKWGVTSPVYISKVLGEFPEVSEDSLIPISWVRAAVERGRDGIVPYLEGEPRSEIGVDVARKGRNETVLYHRKGLVGRLYAVGRKRDLMYVCGMVVNAVRETSATKVKVDDTGLGGGVTDRLLEMQREGDFPRSCTIVPVNVGNKPLSDEAIERFHNLKAQLCWQVHDLFEDGNITIDDDMDTQAQICAVRYSMNSKGKIVIESKDDLEERLRDVGGSTGDSLSPDRFDALVLAFAELEEESGWELLVRKARREREAREAELAARQLVAVVGQGTVVSA